MRYSILLSVAVLLLSSCLTEKRRGEVFHAYAAEHREKILPYCPPPTVTTVAGKPDTVVRTDTVKVKVPYAVPGTKDTIWVDCPDTEHINNFIYRTDTVYQENRAEIERQVLLRQDAEKNTAVAEALLVRAEKRAKERLWISTGLIVLLVLAIAVKIKGLI